MRTPSTRAELTFKLRTLFNLCLASAKAGKMPRSIAYSSDAEDRARSIIRLTPQGSPERRGEDETQQQQEPARTETGPSLKVTLRTSINHLVNPAQAPSSPGPLKVLPNHMAEGGSEVASSRSPSLSPSAREPARKRVRQAASYSSDSEHDQHHDQDMPHDYAFKPSETGQSLPHELPPAPERPKKKPRKSGLEDGKKKYDWMETPAEGSGPAAPSWAGDADVQLLGSGSTDPVKPKKPPRKKKPDGVVGPGKNWRKGIKKGMPLPWATEDGMRTVAYDDSTRSHPAPTLVLHRGPSISPEPSGPAVAAELGFPVLRKPPISKLVPLGPIPKISAQFATNDTTSRDRKEHCRTWQRAARTIFNVTGTRLKFHTWLGSPTSELAEALQREHAAKLAQAQTMAFEEMNFAGPFSGPPPPEKSKGKGKASASHSATPSERPGLVSSSSFDSSFGAAPPHFKGSMLGPGAMEYGHASPLRFEVPTDDLEQTEPAKKKAKPRKSVSKVKVAPLKEEMVDVHPEVGAVSEANIEPDVDDVIASALE